MNSPAQPSEENLDPQQRQLIRKMRRLMAVGLLTMLIGVFAVFAVIYYRTSNAPDRSPSRGSILAITHALPKGSKVISTAVSDGRIAVTIERDGITEIRVFDLGTLQLRGTLRLEPQ
jgi:hypothetical protein